MVEGRSPAAEVRLGVCYYLLGRYSAAIHALKSGDGEALAHFYLAKTYFALGQYEEAMNAFAAAAKAGYNADDCALGQADAQRMSGNAKAALQILDSLSGAVEQTAEYLFQRGAAISAPGGNPTEVVALFERAVESDPNHAGICLGSPRKMIAAATTRWRWICTRLGRSVSNLYRHAVEPRRAL